MNNIDYCKYLNNSVLTCSFFYWRVKKKKSIVCEYNWNLCYIDRSEYLITTFEHIIIGRFNYLVKHLWLWWELEFLFKLNSAFSKFNVKHERFKEMEHVQFKWLLLLL